MADRKITDLTALAAGSQATGDLLTIVDVSEGAAADKNKKITVESLFKGIPENVGIGTASPSAKLHVNSGTTNTCATFESTDAGAAINLTDSEARSTIEQNGSTLSIIADTDASDASSNIRLKVDNSTKLIVDSSGNVGIGVTNPSSYYQHGDNLVVGNSGASSGITIRTGNVNQGILAFADGTTGGSQQYAGYVIYSHNDEAMMFATGATERMRIDSSGRLLIGATASTHSDAQARLQVHSAGASNIVIARNDSTISAGNTIGMLQFYGNDGGTYQQCAEIRCDADLNHNNNDKPSRLVFGTTANGASSSTERMRIDSSGNVGINEASPDSTLHVTGPTSGTILTLDRAGSYSWKIGQSSGSDLTFTGDTNERMRMLAGGGITFNGDTAAANALNDYEEGTATIATFTGNSTGSNNVSGSYVKIGTKVFCTGSAIISGSTDSSITGVFFSLPFSRKSGTGVNGNITAVSIRSGSRPIFGEQTLGVSYAYGGDDALKDTITIGSYGYGVAVQISYSYVAAT